MFALDGRSLRRLVWCLSWAKCFSLQRRLSLVDRVKQVARKLVASDNISVRGLGLFLGRISGELDVMRGRMFDHERKHLGSENYDAARLAKLEEARKRMYEAHSALLAAQAELLK